MLGSNTVLYRSVGRRLLSVTLSRVEPHLVPHRAGVQQGVAGHAGIELLAGVFLLRVLFMLVLPQQRLKLSLSVGSILSLGDTQITFFIFSLELSNPVLCKGR